MWASGSGKKIEIEGGPRGHAKWEEGVSGVCARATNGDQSQGVLGASSKIEEGDRSRKDCEITQEEEASDPCIGIKGMRSELGMATRLHRARGASATRAGRFVRSRWRRMYGRG